jgi:hypothetical protein
LPPRSASEAIHPAIEHTKNQVFHRFHFGQWMRLAFVGVLAGEMSSGGCNGVNFNMPAGHGGQVGHGSSQAFLAARPPWIGEHPLMVAASFAIVLLVGFALIVLFTYISSVMRFILFDSVIARECHIRRGWARRRTIGLRLFWWQLVFSLLTTAGVVVLLAVPALLIWRLGWFTFPREHILGLVLAGVAVFLLLFLIIAVVAVIRVMTKDFVVPQMALENIGAMEGWRRLLTRVQQEKVGYAGYIGMKLVLAIAAAIIFGIITFVVLLLVLIPVGGFGLVAVLGGKAAGLSWNVFTIAAAVMAAVWVLALLVAIVSLIYVPAMVFFPAYSIYFFAPRYPPLADLLWPMPAPPPTPSPQTPPTPTNPFPSGAGPLPAEPAT